MDKQKRMEIDQRLTAITTRSASESAPTPGLLRTPLFGIVSARVLSGLWADELSTAQRRWQAREISNVRRFFLFEMENLIMNRDENEVYISMCSKPNFGSNTERCYAVSGLSWVIRPLVVPMCTHHTSSSLAWVLQDYISPTLDLTKPETYRE